MGPVAAPGTRARRRKPRPAGFTLVEILVVIVVLAIAAGVAFIGLGAAITLHLDPAAVHVFGSDGRLLRAPERGGQR